MEICRFHWEEEYEKGHLVPFGLAEGMEGRKQIWKRTVTDTGV